jgi:hypothetical protein
MNLELLTDIRVKVTTVNSLDVKTYYEFELPKWSPTAEESIEFPIQTYIQAIQIDVSADILLQSKKKYTLKCTKAISVELNKTTNFMDFYLQQ